MDPKDLLKMLDLDGKPPDTAKESGVISPAAAGDVSPPDASPTALEVDAWGLRRGRDLVAESDRLRNSGTDEFAAADFFASAFDPDPRLVEACIDRRRHQFISQLLDTPDYRSLHAATPPRGPRCGASNVGFPTPARAGALFLTCQRNRSLRRPPQSTTTPPRIAINAPNPITFTNTGGRRSEHAQTAMRPATPPPAATAPSAGVSLPPAEGGGAAVAGATGTATDALQCGHWTCWPANRSSAYTSWPHPHLTSIAITTPASRPGAEAATAQDCHS